MVPSKYEIPVLSPTVLEAFASGAVVITTSSISRDLIQPGENCLTAETPLEAATAVDRLMIDEEGASAIAQKALQKVKDFDAANVAHRLIQRLSTPT